ncbi:unnamed protein product [Parajaminaea phylloscopi]
MQAPEADSFLRDCFFAHCRRILPPLDGNASGIPLPTEAIRQDIARVKAKQPTVMAQKLLPTADEGSDADPSELVDEDVAFQTITYEDRPLQLFKEHNPTLLQNKVGLSRGFKGNGRSMYFNVPKLITILKAVRSAHCGVNPGEEMADNFAGYWRHSAEYLHLVDCIASEVIEHAIARGSLDAWRALDDDWLRKMLCQWALDRGAHFLNRSGMT